MFNVLDLAISDRNFIFSLACLFIYLFIYLYFFLSASVQKTKVYFHLSSGHFETAS